MSEYKDNDIIEQMFNDENLNIENAYSKAHSSKHQINEGLTEILSASVRAINDCKCEILNDLYKLYENIKYDEPVQSLLKSIEVLTEKFQNFTCDCLDDLQEINSKYGDDPQKIVIN